ncbi:MAG TPA: endolytic transglycosylase MltG [Terriglobales bacterium]|nr:endolytic transglycosylase MltG [Terriglobales bacterium]
MRALLKLVAVAILVVAAWLVWALWLPLRPPGQKFVLLHPGYSTRHIAVALKSAGVIRSSTAFLLWHFVAHPRTLKAGEYLFDQPANALQVHRRLARGDVYVHTVVIPEGFNIFEIAQAVAGAGLSSEQEFLSAARADTVLVRDLDPQASSLEGYLFPDTYQFTRTETPTDMLAVMVHRFRSQAHAIGLTANVHQVVTMASIVEKETAVPEERPVVASVYFNRLRQRIALDADPSIIYAEMLAGTYTGSLHHDDMQFESPYNTYRHTGLPPGPIANPGVASLQAAMHPANTAYLYFVSAGDGHHRFATTLEEHNHNVALYRKAVSVMR